MTPVDAPSTRVGERRCVPPMQVARPEKDALWTKLGATDEPHCWAAARALADLGVDVARMNITRSLLLTASGADILRRRVEAATVLLRRLLRTEAMPFDDEARAPPAATVGGASDAAPRRVRRWPSSASPAA